MICEATRRILKRLPIHHLEIEEFTYLERPSQEEIERINRCDQAVFVGTNVFQSHALGWAWLPEDWRRIQIPYWFYGVGYSGPLQGDPREICEETNELVNWSRGAEAIGVRDPHTARWLKERGVHSELVGCPVLGYTKTFSGVALGEGKPVLAVRQILLHSPGEEAAATQRVMIDWFFKEYPDGICVVQEPADLSLLEGKPVVTDFEEIVHVLSQARFVLSGRLHAGMLALTLGRPAVFLAHDTRVASFCEMVGLPSRKLNCEGLREAIHAIQTIERGDLTEFHLAVTRIPLFRKRLDLFWGDILAERELERVSTREARTRKLLIQLQSDFYEMRWEVAWLREQLRQREAGLIEQLQARNHQIASFQEQLKARDLEVVELRRKLNESQQTLTEIYNSFGWKLLERCWRWVNWFLPPGTRRRLWYSRMLRAVKIVLSQSWRGLWRRLKARFRSKQLQQEDLEELSLLPVEWEQEAKRHDKTRLLVLVPTMGAGGMERCTEVLLKHFNRDLFQLGLAMIFDSERFYQVPEDVDSFILERYRQPVVKASFEGLPSHIVTQYQNELTWLEATAYKAGVLISKLKPDVVLAQDFFAAIIALFAKKYVPQGIKIFGSAHNQYSTLMTITPKGDLYTTLIQRYFNEADRIIAVSQGIAADLIEGFGVRPDVIAVIHKPMDLKQIERLAQEAITEHHWFGEDVPILLFVGRLTSQKGVPYLFRAMAQARKLELFRVALIREGEQREELETLAQQLGVADDVLFLGRQSNPFKFMQRATCFVLPSVVEGLPYVILEAMACGCPIIATDCAPGIRELLGKGERGVLVQPKAPDALVEAILKVLWDKDLRERLTQAGLQYVKQFAAENIVSQYEELVKAHVSINAQ